MSSEFIIKISTSSDLSGAAATVAAREKITRQTGKVTAEHASAAGAVDQLAQAAARTPGASLESLADSARQVRANAGATRQPLTELANASEGFLSKLETGFGIDFHEKIIHGVEEIGHAFTEAGQHGSAADRNPPRPVAGSDYREDGDPGGGLHTGGLKTGSLGEVETSTAAGVLARTPSAASLLARGSLQPAIPTTGSVPGAGLLNQGVGSFSDAPTATASLGPALAGLGARPAAATPGAPAGGNAEAVGQSVGTVDAAAGSGFQEAARAVDRLHSTLVRDFQTLNERIERVEQAACEHTSQIGNRS